MQVTINVDETMFTEVIDKELKALSSDELKKIILEVISEYFRRDNYKHTEELIFKNPSTNYYSKEFTPLMDQMVKSADYSGLQDVVDKCIEEVKSNYEHLLIKSISSAIIRGLRYDYQFGEVIEEHVNIALSKKENQNQGW
jgi:hypothetical protein